MSARGRLKLLSGLLNNQLVQSKTLNERIFSCILCGSCEKLCPTQVEITEAIYHGRGLLTPLDWKSRYLRQVIRYSLQRPMLGFRIVRMLQGMGVTPGKVLGILGTKFDIAVPHSPLKDEQQQIYKPDRKIGRIALFTGCSTNFLFPHLGESLINVLLHLGYEVVLPKGEVCCGVPLRSLGLEDEAVEMAKKNYEIFSRLKVEAILSLCPTCILSIKVQYPKLIGKGLDKAIDLSSFLMDKLDLQQAPLFKSFKTVTYHDPCHLNYSLGIKEEPRELIRYSGAELIEAEGEGCCGFGGVFSLLYKDISGHLLEKRVDAYMNTGAEAVVTACPGCMLQLSSGIKDKSLLHIIELIEAAVC
jgi:glycolate oxidase iron-sulfur subunit